MTVPSTPFWTGCRSCAFFGVDPFPLQDAKTIWNFKNELAKGDMVNKLFKKLDNRLDKEGVIIHEARWPMPPL
jgi:IS5 family transposase